MPLLPKITDLAPNSWTAPFWDGLRRHEILAPECAACGRSRMPPAPLCTTCGTVQPIKWQSVSTRGTVYSFTIARQAFHRALEDHVPYVIAVVSLDEIPEMRLITNVVDVDPSSMSVGMSVEVIWDHVEPDLVLARFRPASDTECEK